MYKIENELLLKYINNEEKENLSETEKYLFDFLVNTVPETMLYEKVDPEENDGNPYKENVDFLTLLVVLSKVIGGSRELILNLEKAQSLPEIVKGIVDDSKKNLKDNNLRLLALKAEEIGFNIDLTKITRGKSEYLNDLEKYFNLIVNKYETTRNRGSQSALYQVLRDYNSVDERVGFSEVVILDAGSYDTIAESLGLDGETQVPGGEPNEKKPDRTTIPAGTLRIYLENMPGEFGYQEGVLNFDNSFDYTENYFYLDRESELYKYFMNIKPTGLFYELIIKSTAYMILATQHAFSLAGSADYQNHNLPNGFREIIGISLLQTPSCSIYYTDNISSIENVHFQIGTKVNIDYDINIEIKATGDGGNTVEQGNKETLNKPKNSAHWYQHNLIDFGINNEEDFNDLQEIEVTYTVSDKFDINNNIPTIKTFQIPEIMYPGLVSIYAEEVSRDQYNVEYLIEIFNGANRQDIYLEEVYYTETISNIKHPIISTGQTLGAFHSAFGDFYGHVGAPVLAGFIEAKWKVVRGANSKTFYTFIPFNIGTT